MKILIILVISVFTIDLLLNVYKIIHYKRFRKKFDKNFKEAWDGVFERQKKTNTLIEEARREANEKYEALQLENRLKADNECQRVDWETIEKLNKIS